MEKNKNESPLNKPLIKSLNQFPVVGIGASAGGLDAFKKLLKAIPENSGMAFVLVQHLDPSHESLLPELLQKATNIPVLEISDDIKVKPDHIYIIPSNKIMIANDGVLLLSPRTTNKNERNLPVDIFFASLAEVHQSYSIGVVLSGTASDGTKGLKAIKDHGGITIAQSEESAAYDGMPQSAIQAGVVDFILPPEEIPQKLLEITQIVNAHGSELENPPQQDADVFRQMLSLLRIRKGTDFTYYKQTTIRRRILRRMALNKNAEPRDYLKILRENKKEQDLLYQDLLIPVTSFFRDPKSFDNLCKTVFPAVVRHKKPDDPIRVWVAGCSTGQEVYSIAICLKEFLGYNGSPGERRIQLFATDISEPAIAKARTGIYTKSEAEGLTPQRLHEFFTKTNAGYQVNKSIRDMCVFTVHNFLKDPPFGKLDLISCRNVLIYMEPYLQKKTLTTFHYALNKSGFLLLGKSETISGVPELFGTAMKHDKIFSRKDVPGKYMHTATLRSEQSFADTNENSKNENTRTDFQKTADDIMLSKYTPAGVVVNETMDIVHFRGKTGRYLEQLPGKPSHNLLKMAKEGLAFELRNILHKAKKENAAVTKEHIPIKENDTLRNITIEAMPLPNLAEPHYLVLFHEGEIAGGKQLTAGSKKSGAKNTDKDLRIQQLEKELSQLREDMRSITEDQEAVNEELQSANEELLSGSEELQSLNEELETGKEELQSTNEELTVVNQEMIGLNEQVTEARDYSEAIVETVREPLLVLDKNLRVKSANQAFYKIFQVNEPETESKLIYDLGNGQWDIPELRNLLERILPENAKLEAFEVSHHFESIGYRTMVINARQLVREGRSDKLILLAIEDVTEQKKSEQDRSLLSTIVDSSTDAIISKTLDGIITSWNKGAKVIFGYDAIEVIGKHISILIPSDLLHEEEMVIGKIKTAQRVEHFETVRVSKNGTKINVSLTISPIKDKSGKITGASKIARDITSQVQSAKRIEESEKQYRDLIQGSPVGIYTCNAVGDIELYNETAVKLWGRTPEVGKDKWCGSWKIWDTDGTLLPHDQCPMAVALKEGRSVSREIIVEQPDGTKFCVIPYPQPIFDSNGKLTGAINTLIDITPQIVARKKIEASERRQADFVTMLSHELKTPITSIKAYVQLILRMVEQEQEIQFPVRLKPSLIRVDKLVLQLTSLITEMLDLTRIEANKLELKIELVSLNGLVNGIVEDFQYTNPKHTINMYHDFSCTVHVDTDKIRQVLINFIGNAIKYSPNKDTIDIRIAKAKKNWVAVSVTDYGIGIEKKDHQKIFERFYRVEGKTEQSFSGLGIGLFIAHSIVERHNGQITIDSEKGKGSVFTFTLPVAPTSNRSEGS